MDAPANYEVLYNTMHDMYAALLKKASALQARNTSLERQVAGFKSEAEFWLAQSFA